MKNCKRCGVAFQHNYLVAIFRMIKEKNERMIVCLKCRDILHKQDSAVPGVLPPKILPAAA